jgi:hypothetical protein
VTDEHQTPDEPTEGGSQQPEIDISKLPSLPTHPRSQTMPGTNIGRWATFGCVAIMLILVVLLVVGVSLTKRTVWMAYARAQQRVVESLPRDLPSAERLRIERNLQRFRARLDMTADPMPLMGSFLAEVTAAFDDEQLSVEEVGGLNEFIEDALDSTGVDGP